MEMDARGLVVHRLVLAMIPALVDEPGAVEVVSRMQDECLVIDVTVAKEDIGKVVGKQGRMARSLRTILSAAGRKHGLRCELNITE